MSRFCLCDGEYVDCVLSFERANRLWHRMFRKKEFFFVAPGLMVNPLKIICLYKIPKEGGA